MARRAAARAGAANALYVAYRLGRWVAKHMGEKEYLWERGLSAHRRPRKKEA